MKCHPLAPVQGRILVTDYARQNKPTDMVIKTCPKLKIKESTLGRDTAPGR